MWGVVVIVVVENIKGKKKIRDCWRSTKHSSFVCFLSSSEML